MEPWGAFSLLPLRASAMPFVLCGAEEFDSSQTLARQRCSADLVHLGWLFVVLGVDCCLVRAGSEGFQCRNRISLLV